MSDIVSPETRSRMMAGIRNMDTKPELTIRKSIHSMGFRYILHDKRLPGKPDLVFPQYRAVILVNGCFWHRHDCHLFKYPSSRAGFWRTKLNRNRERDAQNRDALEKKGWRILIVWECAIKGRTRRSMDYVAGTISTWLESGRGSKQIEGT